MHSESTLPLLAKLQALAEAGSGADGSTTEARSTLESLLRAYPNFQTYLQRRFTRLPDRQQQVLLSLVQTAQARDFLPLLQAWSHSPELPLATRARILTIEEGLGNTIDAPYRDALVQAVATLHQLRTPEGAQRTEDGELQTVARDAVLNLPLALGLDLAQELTAEQPEVALAVLRALRPVVDEREMAALVEGLGAIPLAASASTLQELLAETTSKALQKTIKRALHRLKTQGVPGTEVERSGHSARAGTVAHRLERCLASHIDGLGYRVFWFIRTKPFGGYNVAYVIGNYDTGIKEALRLQVNKRELPHLLAKTQEHIRLIELEPIYCQYQVALLQQLNLDTGTPVPEEYLALRDVIGTPATVFERALIYSVLTEADLHQADASRHHTDELLELPELGGWTLPISFVEKYGARLQEIEESPLVTSQTLQQERINEVYAQAMAEALDDRTRRLMRLRLEETAYYLLQTERRREALIAVAAARSLQETASSRLLHNAFLKALLERSLEGAKRRSSSSIILPSSHLGSSRSGRLIV